MTEDADPDGAGSAGREVTGSDRVERRELARGHIGPDDDPVRPRPAATMVLARPGRGVPGDRAPDGGPAGVPDREGRALELLFLRRPEGAAFAAGAWVFPGGVVDEEDRAADLEERLGPDVTPEEPAALAAALREGFEETGLLPADRPPPEEAGARARERLLAGETDFATVVRSLDLEFRGLEAAYFARWITPPRLSRRYDARFFLVRHRGGEPRLIHGEHTGARWLAPAEAMRRFETGELPMLYPTRRTVETLAGLGTLEDAFAVLRERTVEPSRPRLLIDDGTVTPVLPDDPRYEAAARRPEDAAEGGEGGP